MTLCFLSKEIIPQLSISTWSKNVTEVIVSVQQKIMQQVRSALSSRSWYYRSPSSCCASLSHTRTGCGFPVWPVKLTFFAQCYWREDRLLLLFSPEFQTCPQSRERAGQRGPAANESEKLLCFTRLTNTLLHFHNRKINYCF